MVAFAAPEYNLRERTIFNHDSDDFGRSVVAIVMKRHPQPRPEFTIHLTLEVAPGLTPTAIEGLLGLVLSARASI